MIIYNVLMFGSMCLGYDTISINIIDQQDNTIKLLKLPRRLAKQINMREFPIPSLFQFVIEKQGYHLKFTPHHVPNYSITEQEKKMINEFSLLKSEEQYSIIDF